MRALPRDIACERAIIDCLLVSDLGSGVDPMWFWGEGRGLLLIACNHFWQVGYFQKPRTRSVLETLVTGNENALRLGREVSRLKMWKFGVRLRTELQSIRNTYANPWLFDWYVNRVRRAWELRNTIEECERTMRAAYRELVA